MKDITYRKEELFFSPYATKSISTKGREIQEEPCPFRTEFQRDRDRIIHSKAFRRLKNKTQVFLAPEGDHYRTRMTHTLDVTQIARSIARVLNLNEDLAEAGALGHDLGHTPFGHSGERTLSRLTDGYFMHNCQSLRIVEVLEKEGKGLNLTSEVKDGILNHRTECVSATLEGRIIMYADKIAYVNHDIDDSIRANALKLSDIPQDITDVLGMTSQQRINTMITSIYNASSNKEYVTMEEDVQLKFEQLRKFLFTKVYNVNDKSDEHCKADKLIEYLFNYYYSNPSLLPSSFFEMIKENNLYVVICDFIASMSDTYAINLFSNLVLPKRWNI